MAVTSINSTQAWRLDLTGEAQVDTNTGEIALTVANFGPGGGTAGVFATLAVSGAATIEGELVVDDDTTLANVNVGGTATLYEVIAAGAPVDLSGADSLAIPQASPLNTYPLQVFINTIVSATKRTGYVIVPAGGEGTIVDISGICDATPTVGSAIFTPSISNSGIAAPIDDGVLTFTTGDTVPSPQTATPDPHSSVVFGGSIVWIETSGANTAAGTCMITLTIRRAAP